MTDEDDKQWTVRKSSAERADGLVVRITIDEVCQIWEVVPAEGAPVLAHCQCCGAKLLTKRAAMLVADAVYPMPPQGA